MNLAIVPGAASGIGRAAARHPIARGGLPRTSSPAPTFSLFPDHDA